MLVCQKPRPSKAQTSSNVKSFTRWWRIRLDFSCLCKTCHFWGLHTPQRCFIAAHDKWSSHAFSRNNWTNTSPQCRPSWCNLTDISWEGWRMKGSISICFLIHFLIEWYGSTDRQVRHLAKHLLDFDRDVKGSLSREELRQVLGGTIGSFFLRGLPVWSCFSDRFVSGSECSDEKFQVGKSQPNFQHSSVNLLHVNAKLAQKVYRCWIHDLNLGGNSCKASSKRQLGCRFFFTCTNFFPKQLWSWMGFSILPRNRFCSIIISGFRLGFRGLSPYSFGILFHHHFLVPARVPGLVSLYSFGILFHHRFLVPARVPGLVSLLFWHPVPSSCPGSG